MRHCAFIKTGCQFHYLISKQVVKFCLAASSRDLFPLRHWPQNYCVTVSSNWANVILPTRWCKHNLNHELEAAHLFVRSGAPVSQWIGNFLTNVSSRLHIHWFDSHSLDGPPSACMLCMNSYQIIIKRVIKVNEGNLSTRDQRLEWNFILQLCVSFKFICLQAWDEAWPQPLMMNINIFKTSRSMIAVWFDLVKNDKWGCHKEMNLPDYYGNFHYFLCLRMAKRNFIICICFCAVRI